MPRANAVPPIIELSNVSKTFLDKTENIQALKSVNCHIPSNSFTIVFGPSGSGKSTLFNVIIGLEKPTTGEVKFEGGDVYSLSSDERANLRSRAFGMVYQANYWINSLSVIENVALPLILSGYTRREALLFAKQSMDLIDLGQYAENKPFLLSGGQQQRVSLARALVANPLVILADEPTGNLDSKNGLMIINTLKNLQQKYQKTVVMITHNSEYLPFSDHRIIIQDGLATEETGEYNPQKSLITKYFAHTGPYVAQDAMMQNKVKN